MSDVRGRDDCLHVTKHWDSPHSPCVICGLYCVACSEQRAMFGKPDAEATP